MQLRKLKVFVVLVNLPTSALFLQLLFLPQNSVSFIWKSENLQSATTENEDTEKLRLKNQVPADHNISSIQMVNSLNYSQDA
jgi:hypothetical protein